MPCLFLLSTPKYNSRGGLVQRGKVTFGDILSIKNSSGAEITLSPIIKTSYAFAGREWDSVAGLYNNRARYYDPSIGRFLQKDPSPGKISNPSSVTNKYIYANNAPTIFTDPTGKFFFIPFLIAMVQTVAISAAIGAVVGGIIGGILAAQHGDFLSSFAQGFYAGAVSGAVSGALVGLGTFGLGAAATAIFPSASAVAIQYSVGGLMALYGAAAGAQYGIGGVLIGGIAGFFSGFFGSAAGINAWNAASGAAASIPAGVESPRVPIEAPEPVLPTLDDLQKSPTKPPPKQAPIPIRPRG